MWFRNTDWIDSIDIEKFWLITIHTLDIDIKSYSVDIYRTPTKLTCWLDLFD